MRKTKVFVATLWLLTLALQTILQPFRSSAAADPGGLFDVLPPVLESITLDPSDVDVTAGSATVTVTLHLTDDLSGVDFFDPAANYSGRVDFYPPYMSGASQSMTLYTYDFQLVGGTPDYLDTTWQATLAVPAGSAPGLWTIAAILFDRAGNRLDAYPPNGLNIQSIADLTPPTISELQFIVPGSPDPVNPATVDTSAEGQTVKLRFRVVDFESGFGTNDSVSDFDHFYVYANADNNNTFGYWTYRVMGDDKDGIWETDVYFPRYSPTGPRTLTFYIKDNAGNSTWYFGSDLGVPGDPLPELNIFSDPSDSQPPTLISVSFSPITIDTSTTNQVVTATVTANDDLSGVSFLGLRLRSPSHSQERWMYCYPTNAGVAGIQGLQGTTLFPKFSEGGTWRVDYYYFYDSANNFIGFASPAPEVDDLNASISIIFATLNVDGTVDPTGGTVQDPVFGERAQVTIPPGAVAGNTTVAIDVLESPLDLPSPTGFAGPNTYYVNIHLDPQPDYPLAPPGLTVVLPLLPREPKLAPGTVLNLYRINEITGLLEPSMTTDSPPVPVTGTVNADQMSATFTKVSRLSTVVALVPDPVITWPTPVDITYGTVLSSVQQNASANVPGAFAYSPAPGTLLPAGDAQILKVTFTPDDLVNYKPVEQTVLLNVKKAPLTMRADDKAKVAGAPMPALTVTYEGFIPGEGTANLATLPAVQTAATASSPAGKYDITVSGAAAANYDISYVKGTLTVLPSIALKAVSYSLIASKRISLTVWDYTYKFVLKNEGASPAYNVSARVTKYPAQVNPTDPSVTFGTVPALQTVTGQDTFTLRMDRSKPVNNSDLGWTIRYSSDSGGADMKSVEVPF